jgi:uncharacterized protein (TIGR02996 family)
MRTFTFSDATSHKFWNIDVQGNSLTVTYGRIGAKGQTQTKTFASAAKAEAEADKLVKEKLAKGYRETTAGAIPTPPGVPKEMAALEAAILANPDDRGAYMAYADWLTEHGDPRGEFVQVQLALEDESRTPAERKKLRQREKALLTKHEQEWVGDWLPLARAKISGPEGRGQLDFPGPKPYHFVRGCLAEVTIDELTIECARAFIASTQTRLVQSLRVGGWAFQEREPDGTEIGDGAESTPDEESYTPLPGDNVPEDSEEPSQYVLMRWPYFANLRFFQLGWTSQEEYGADNFCPFQCHLRGDNAHAFVRQIPRVEELYLFAHSVHSDRLFAFLMPHLRVLQLYHTWYYPLSILAKNASLTNLTHLLCHPHAPEAGDAPYIRLPDLKAVVRSPHLGNLKRLRLRCADFGDAGCKEIVASGILKRLEVLDLRHGCITDEGARLLAECPDLKRLQLLHVANNKLTTRGVELLRGVGTLLRAEDQDNSNGQDPSYGDRRYLFEADYE